MCSNLANLETTALRNLSNVYVDGRRKQKDFTVKNNITALVQTSNQNFVVFFCVVVGTAGFFVHC